MKRKAKKWDVFFNKKRKHPSTTISDDGCIWKNMTLSHSNKGDSFIELDSEDQNKKTYVRKYINKDNSKLKGRFYKNIKFTDNDKSKIENYLKNKKR